MWYWIIATLAAYFVKGLCGFANTLIFTTILGFGANNVNISPVDIALSYPSNIIVTFTNRKYLKTKIWLPLAAMVLLGSIPGAFLLKNVDAQYIKILFGVVIILLGVEMFFRERATKRAKESKVLLFVIGIVSGVLCGLFGVGALLAAYVGRITGPSDEFKANINAVFIVENTFRIVLYCVLGVINIRSLRQSLILLPFMILGLIGGILSGKFIDDKIVKKLVVILLIISGIALVIMNL